jgi:hypothetical protein
MDKLLYFFFGIFFDLFYSTDIILPIFLIFLIFG